MTDFYILVLQQGLSEYWLDPVCKEVLHLFNGEIVGTIEFSKHKIEWWDRTNKIREAVL